MTLDALVAAWRLGYTDGQRAAAEKYQDCQCQSPPSPTNVVHLDDYRTGIRRAGTN